MLIQRIEYQCNYASDNATFEDSKSGIRDTLIEAMKYYSIVEEPCEVYSSTIIAIEDSSSEEK